jgi:mRNA-degrading endonuclease HigB of HigAB toxin-antitoxin module
MILNENYYKDLINKYSIQQDCNKTVYLSDSMIIKNYESRNVYFNFPKGYDLQKIINLLYENLSKQIFKKYADIKGYSVGDRLKKTDKKSNKIYVVSEIKGNKYILTLFITFQTMFI